MAPPRAALALALALAACAAGPGAAAPDAAPDVPRADAPADAAPPDAPRADAPADAAPPDAPRADAATDAPRDAATDAPRDAATDAPPADAAPAPFPARYPDDRSLSPVTPYVVQNLRAIAARGAGLRGDVFAKVGASSTVSTSFLHCFAGPNVDLAGRAPLRATIDHFRAGDAGGTNPYQRASLAATVGWSARNALAGSPSALQREVDAISPRVAVVMYGTNDIQLRDLWGYAENMLTLTDTLTRQGVVPALTSVMPRDDDDAADALVPQYNAVVRAVAEVRQVPFIDLHRELAALPDHGLGPDRLHMNAYAVGGASRPCVFTPEGLRHGYNLRNLLTLQTLHRVRDAVLVGAPAPDPPGRAPEGDGSAARPFVIDAVPFADYRDTRASPHRAFDAYPGCAAAQDESGPEYVYRLTVDGAVTVRVMAFARGGADVDLHLLDRTGTPAGCVARHDRVLVARLAPGVHHLAVDTFVPRGSAARAGEYLLVLMRE